jgi:hypothetical protein
MVMKWAACVAVLCGTPAFAQSGGGTFLLDHTSLISVAPAHEYVAANAIPKQLSLPHNLQVAPAYRPLVEQMLRGSSTFRRQCMRIGGEKGLSVQLNMNVPSRRSDMRATTLVTRARDGSMTAVIDVFPMNDNVELIAHELEHVIEQLDEIDLAAYAAHGGSGVRMLSQQVFETTRARRTGVKVTGEVRAFTGRR